MDLKESFSLKEFIVCYIYDNDIKREKMIKEQFIQKTDIIQEILEKISQQNYFLLKDGHEDHLINSSMVRYIKVSERSIVS